MIVSAGLKGVLQRDNERAPLVLKPREERGFCQSDLQHGGVWCNSPRQYFETPNCWAYKLRVLVLEYVHKLAEADHSPPRWRKSLGLATVCN